MGERVRAVAGLWREAVLDPDANAQFGEGGAGTFSDGKLTTRIGHPAIRYVLETFVRFGANPRVRYLARPHVGTDVIRKCSVLIRKDAEARGARYRFRARLADLRFRDGAVAAAVLDTGEEIPCDALVLAPGHSARDTLEMLHRHGVAMRQKAFAMGVRVEHPQDLIDRSQYGPSQGHPSLAPADYKLVCNLGPARAAYSFCMCPGGEVIQCASEPGGVVVNGMSNARRDSGFANSGLVAKVNTADFGSEHLLGGMYFQRKWEQAAYRAAGETYGAPATSVQDFLHGRASGQLPATSFRPFAVPADITTCLPGFVVGPAARRHPRLRPQAARLHQPPGPAAGHRKPHQQPGAAAARGRRRIGQPPGALPLRRRRRLRRRHHFGGGGRHPGGGVDRPQGRRAGVPAFRAQREGGGVRHGILIGLHYLAIELQIHEIHLFL